MAIKNLGKIIPKKGVDYFTEEDIKELNIPTKTSELENDSLFATENYVKNEIANAQLGGDGGNVDLSGYATKDDLHSHDNKNILDDITADDIKKWNSGTVSGSITRKQLADDLAEFVGSNSTIEATNQYGYGWYYDHTRRTAGNILGEMYRTKIANEILDDDTVVLEQDGDALVHNVCIAEDTSRSKIYAVYAVSTDSTDNASSTNCYVRLSVISNPYTKASRSVEHFKVSGKGTYGNLNIISGTSDANVSIDTNGVVHIWFNATDTSGIWKIAHCTFDTSTGTFADYDWCTLKVGDAEATALTDEALTSIDDPSITYKKSVGLQMNAKYCVFDNYIYAGICCGEVTPNGIIVRSLATDCKNWEFVCCPQWQHESHGKCELSISDTSPYNQTLYIALRQVYQPSTSVGERASAPMLVAMVDRKFNIQKEWLVPDCASRPWFIGQNTLIHNPENRHSANIVTLGTHGAYPISFERIGYANYLAGFIQNNGWGNHLVLAGTDGSGAGSKVGISFINKNSNKILISSYTDQKSSESSAMEYFASAGMNLDTTLSKAGQPADAKAVGTALANKQKAGNYVTSINGIVPDTSGNVVVEVSSGGGGGGADIIDTLIDTTLEQEATNVTVTVDNVKYKEFLVYVTVIGTATNTSTQPITLTANNNRLIGMSPDAAQIKVAGSKTFATIENRLYDDCSWFSGVISTTVNATTMGGYTSGVFSNVGRNTAINSLCVSPMNKWATLGVGTKILLKGVRA